MPCDKSSRTSNKTASRTSNGEDGEQDQQQDGEQDQQQDGEQDQQQNGEQDQQQDGEQDQQQNGADGPSREQQQDGNAQEQQPSDPKEMEGQIQPEEAQRILDLLERNEAALRAKLQAQENARRQKAKPAKDGQKTGDVDALPSPLLQRLPWIGMPAVPDAGMGLGPKRVRDGGPQPRGGR